MVGAQARNLPVYQSGVHPDARLRCAVEPGPLVVLRDFDSYGIRWSVPEPASGRGWPCVSPDARLVAFGLQNGGVRLLHTADGSLAADIVGHAGDVNCTRFSADSSQLITASEDGQVRKTSIKGGTGLILSNTNGHNTRIKLHGTPKLLTGTCMPAIPTGGASEPDKGACAIAPT